MEKQFNGKAIYQPKGAAAEYSKWACNFYVGCSNSCTYCFNRRFGWGNVPTLKKCFRSKEHALEIFEKELKGNWSELKKHCLFFSFSTDPMLPETMDLTIGAIKLCIYVGIKVKILTKRTDWIGKTNSKGDLSFRYHNEPFCTHELHRKSIAIGFTLTGNDELETGASTNAERIEAMQKLHEAGFKTFASIEPVIDYERSLDMIKQTSQFCDLYKIGLQSGKKYDRKELRSFMEVIMIQLCRNNKIYFKDSLLKAVRIDRENNLSLTKNCVGSDYDLFNQ